MNFSTIQFATRVANINASVKIQYPTFTWYCDIVNGEQIILPLYAKVIEIQFCKIRYENDIKIIIPLACTGEISHNDFKEDFSDKFNLNFNIDPLPRGCLKVTIHKI